MVNLVKKIHIVRCAILVACLSEFICLLRLSQKGSDRPDYEGCYYKNIKHKFNIFKTLPNKNWSFLHKRWPL